MQLDLPLTESFIKAMADAVRAGPAATGVSRQLEVDVVRSARRRTLVVTVSAQGRVQVRAPMRVSQADIAGFVDRHRDWILRKLDEAARRPSWQPSWSEGGEWFWRGDRVVLRGGGRRGGELRGLVLQLPLGAGDAEEAWRQQVFGWHRRAAARLLVERAEELFGLHCGGHCLHRVELRWMRATWGTCGGRRAADGRREVKLRLNPWLASLPPHLCDAILLHELAHVEHMNHGAGFYRRLERLNPDWRAHDAELKQWSGWLLPIRDR